MEIASRVIKEFHALNRWKNLIHIQPFLVDYQWHMIMICDSCISDKPRHSRKSNLIKGLVVLQIKLSCIKTSNNIISFRWDVTILLHNKRYCQSIFCLLDHFSLIKIRHYTKIQDSVPVLYLEICDSYPSEYETMRNISYVFLQQNIWMICT